MVKTKTIILHNGRKLTLYQSDTGIWSQTSEQAIANSSRLNVILMSESGFSVDGIQFSRSEIRIIKEYAESCSIYNRQKIKTLADTDCGRLKQLIKTIKETAGNI